MGAWEYANVNCGLLQKKQVQVPNPTRDGRDVEVWRDKTRWLRWEVWKQRIRCQRARKIDQVKLIDSRSSMKVEYENAVTC